MSALWLVWTEDGEYENWSRDLRAIFSDEQMARTHAERLRSMVSSYTGKPMYNEVEVEEREVLADLPLPAIVRWHGHEWDSWDCEPPPDDGELILKRDTQDIH